MRVAEPKAWVVAAAVLFGGVYGYEVHQEHAHAACQSKLNHALINAVGTRSGSSNARQDAEDSLFDGLSVLVLHPAVTKADKARARKATWTLFSDYRTAAAEFKQVKASTPLPVDTPKCGG